MEDQIMRKFLEKSVEQFCKESLDELLKIILEGFPMASLKDFFLRNHWIICKTNQEETPEIILINLILEKFLQEMQKEFKEYTYLRNPERKL